MAQTVAYYVKMASVTLNASTGVGSGSSSTIGAIDDPLKFPFEFLQNAVLDADAEVVDAIPEGSPLLDSFIFSSDALADNSVITVSGGGTIKYILNVRVDNKDARRKPTTYIQRIKADSLARTSRDTYYNIEGGRIIRHSGSTAVLKVVRILRGGTGGTTPQAPDQLTNAVLAKFLSMVTPHMNVWLEMAGYFASEGDKRLAMVKAGQVIIPTVEAYQGVGATA